MLFETRLKEAREALKKLDFDDDLILVHSDPGNTELLESVNKRVAAIIRTRSAVECQPIHWNNHFAVRFGDAMRAVYSATPVPVGMTDEETVIVNRRRQRLRLAFTLAGSAIEMASKYETSIMTPESLNQSDDWIRWTLCLFDASFFGPKGLPGRVTRSLLPTEEAIESLFGTGPKVGCWYAQMPNCRDVSVALIDLMLDIASTNRQRAEKLQEKVVPASADVFHVDPNLANENQTREVTTPPDELIHRVTAQQRVILLCLWNAKYARKWSSLPDQCWREGATSDQNDRTIEGALGRLRDRLNSLPQFGCTLEVHTGTKTTKLVRNQDS